MGLVLSGLDDTSLTHSMGCSTGKSRAEVRILALTFIS